MGSQRWFIPFNNNVWHVYVAILEGITCSWLTCQLKNMYVTGFRKMSPNDTCNSVGLFNDISMIRIWNSKGIGKSVLLKEIA